MPFLLPALFAFTSDIIILWLNRLAPRDAIYEPDEERRLVYRVGYLVPLAVLRLLLLVMPLLFHSYTGTALKFPAFYRLLYWSTLIALVIHMISLSFINPESLEAMFPIETVGGKDVLAHLHELRRLWWMLTFSFIADCCHFVIFHHVRSTAPIYSFLLSNKKPSVYFALRSASFGDGPDGLFTNGDGSEPALVHAMNEFLIEMQSRLQRAKQEWTSRLEDFSSKFASNDRIARVGSTLPAPLFALTPFRVLLQLFAYEEVLENGKLDAVFDADDGASMTFFVPQLLSFLLHGAVYSSPQLEAWILLKCRQNVYFAHRCYWFLRAWCLEVPAEGSPPMVSRQNSENALPSLSHAGLTAFLDEPASPQEAAECGGRRLDGTARPTVLFKSDDKFLPGERAMIERLMMTVKECGETPATRLEYGDGVQANDLMSRKSFDADSSPAALMQAAESGTIPTDPNSGFPSVRHIECLTATQTYGFLPIGGKFVRTHSDVVPGHLGKGETQYFDRTPRFLDALIFLAESLFQVPREQRKDELRLNLRALECELLPSNSVYLPLGNVHHRVWRVVVEESIAINTKERVPCIVCLEVVDFVAKRNRSSSWNFLDRLPRRVQSTESQSEQSFPTDQRRNIIDEVNQMDATEADLVNEWRYARRDPLRRISLFDKMSNTVRENVKGPLKLMKTQVRDKLSQLRDRSVSEELQALTLSESLVRRSSQDLDKAQPEKDDMIYDAESNVQSKSNGLISEADPLSPVPRLSSSGSLSSMGQWSSPDPGAKFLHVLNEPKQSPTSSTCVRRRSERTSEDIPFAPLPYGSDHDEERKIDPPPIKYSHPHLELVDNAAQTTARAPPVVFRESWKTKEDRVRAKSALGSHPGWRLLPILIKANDDLRQEQLASQLIYRMASILAREKVPVWLCPYEIIALTDRGGIIEAIPDTISLDSLKKNDPNFTSLRDFFHSHFGEGTEDLADAKANFVESLAAYSIVCFILQIKDRHNGNILLDNKGHIIHIDFGFLFLSSPGKNAGFESAPFKLTREFVDLLDGPTSHLFKTFRELCVRTFIALRRHSMEIILMVEMLKNGNEELKCFRGRPDDAIRQLRERFRLDLNDRACREYVLSLVDDSIENWRTDWYDRYQRYFVGVL